MAGRKTARPAAAAAPPPRRAAGGNGTSRSTAIATITAPAGRERPAGAGPAPGDVPPAGTRRGPGPVRRLARTVGQHPVASVVAVVAAGALLTWAVRSRHRWRPLLRQAASLRMPDLRPLVAPLVQQLVPQIEPIARRIGVAGVKFRSDLSGGAQRTFGVRWKRRPADAPEDAWYTDEVELGTRRADGGRTDVELAWKTVPPDVPLDDAPRYPGDSALGETSLELETRRPDGRKTGMGFTWRKLPPKSRGPGGTPGPGA